MMKNRRLESNFKLRTHIDALDAAKALTLSQWQDIQATSTEKYISQKAWIEYLEQCIIAETRLSLAA
jgi:hypothetical protein